MRNSRILFTSVVVTSLLLSACTEPGETTSIGAATGGVIGAGLGAIVGNQTGNPGSGLVIGSVAGAGAGAAIGNALEAQQKSVRTQDEALERQQKMLAAQSAEIRELRNMPRDTDSALRGAFNQEARISHEARAMRKSDSYLALSEDSSLSLSDQLNMGADISSATVKAKSSSYSDTSYNKSFSQAETTVSKKSMAIQPRYAELSKNTESLRGTESQPTTHKMTAPQPSIENKIVEERLESQDRDASQDKISAALNERTIDVSNTQSAQVKSESENLDPKKSEAKLIDDSTDTKSSECQKGDSEAEKAESSKEPADKLFYLRRAIRLCPSNASLHKKLADEYGQLGRNEDAKASYEDALKLDPSMLEAKKGIAALSSNKY